MIKEIISKENPNLKLVKKLHKKKERMQEKLFVVEGIRNVTEALIHEAAVKKLFLTKDILKDLNALEKYIHKNVETFILPDKLLKSFSTMDAPQGILAVVEIQDYYFENIELNKDSFIVILDSIQDPGNLGAVIRTCSAAGLNAVIIGKNSVDPYSPKTANASMGSIFHIPILYNINLVEFCTKVQKFYGFKLIAADLRGSDFYFNKDFTVKTAVVIGNENKGVDEKIISLADEVVKIPLLGKAESLNASTAAGILIYEGIRQRDDHK